MNKRRCILVDADKTIDDMAETFKLLGDKTRLTIMAFLKERELCVCNIVDLIQMSQPSVSQHLRKMKAGGLVTEVRRGKWTYYSLRLTEKPYVEELLKHLPSQASKVKQLLDCESASSCDD